MLALFLKKVNREKAIPFFLSQAIILFGSQIVAFAIVWYITLQTSSGFWVAMFSICTFVPQFFISFIGGVWADRHSKKMLIIGADALIALLTLGMVLLLPRFDSRPRHEQQFLGVAAFLFSLILRELRLFEIIAAYLELPKMVGRFVGKTKTPTIWPLHSIWLLKPKH